MKAFVEVRNGRRFKLAHVSTKNRKPDSPDLDYQALLAHNSEAIGDFQTRLYANHRQALLIIFQGMDTAGKDGAIKHVMSGVNPQGCSVVSFKTPTSEELGHDFLWKSSCKLPARGEIGNFNRSYYEEALIARVHPDLLKKERLPKKSTKDPDLWRLRYQDIVNHELHLCRQGYEIIKIFIHISKNEQKRRLLERFNNPKKIWKVSEGDIHERSFWGAYQKAYELCIKHTSTKKCPWYVVPGDDKKAARLSISQILLSRFEKLKLDFPKIPRLEARALKVLLTELNSKP